jgi:hypothetical protein
MSRGCLLPSSRDVDFVTLYMLIHCAKEAILLKHQTVNCEMRRTYYGTIIGSCLIEGQLCTSNGVSVHSTAHNDAGTDPVLNRFALH